jgi:hypothetical protein
MWNDRRLTRNNHLSDCGRTYEAGSSIRCSDRLAKLPMRSHRLRAAGSCRNTLAPARKRLLSQFTTYEMADCCSKAACQLQRRQNR